MAIPPSWHQHCTDEAQKAEIVLSAVSYVYMHVYIHIHIFSINLLTFYHQLFYSDWRSCSISIVLYIVGN